MKFTAILTALMGVVIGCFAGVHSASGGVDRAENPLVLGLVLPLVFAVALVIAGVAMWFLDGCGYTASGLASGRPPADDPVT
jgi:hypothetical protein